MRRLARTAAQQTAVGIPQACVLAAAEAQQPDKALSKSEGITDTGAATQERIFFLPAALLLPGATSY
jgi:hypothetical protein